MDGLRCRSGLFELVLRHGDFFISDFVALPYCCECNPYFIWGGRRMGCDVIPDHLVGSPA